MNRESSPHTMMIYEGLEEEYLSKTDYEVGLQVMHWRLKDGHRCVFCNSPFVEVQEVEVNGHKLYDYDLLVDECKATGNWIFMINLQKKNGHVDVSVGGKSPIDEEIVEACIARIRHEMRKRKPGFYHKHDRGHFFICFTGTKEVNAFEATVQKYVCHGFSLEEVMDALFYYTDKHNLKWF
ncbi:MAG: hypothetical protein H6602_10730 [Flavobacteriales bacterium]|nr:hypothetical protein [Flavobacteriales bacterium]